MSWVIVLFLVTGEPITTALPEKADIAQCVVTAMYLENKAKQAGDKTARAVCVGGARI